MHLPLREQLLLVVQTVALIVLCFRMWRAGLHRIYVYFFSYLLLVLLGALPAALVPFGTVAYGYAWLAFEALVLCFYTLIVLECYANVLRDLRGIASISRLYIKVTVVIAILAALLLMGFEKTPKTLFQSFFTLDRAVVSSLLIFVLLMMLFLVYYPIPLSRNVMLYSAGYTLYFLTKATALFVRNINSVWQSQISTLLIVASTACLIFWGLTLNRRGETRTVVIGHQWHPEDEDRLLSQLKAINASLSRSARK